MLRFFNPMLNNLLPFSSFEEAAQEVLVCLSKRIGFSLWLMTRVEGDDWIVLAAQDNGYGVTRGQVFNWSDSFCYHMAKGEGPRVAPRSAEVEVYAKAPIASQLVINAYVGVPICRADGTLFGTLCAIDPQPQSDTLGEELAIVEVMARIFATLLDGELRLQEEARVLERIKAEALIDELTGLYNRRGWNQLVEAEEQRCRRFGHSAGAVIVDLDDLKRVNDLEGHAAGDELLRAAAQALKEVARAADVVARLGGDEFGILAVEMAPPGIEDLVARIESALRDREINASAGWAVRDPRYGIGHAIEEADSRMYHFKKTKKD